MQFISKVSAVCAILAASVTAQSDVAEPLYLNITKSSLTYSNINTPDVSFANGSAFIGAVKYQFYSEPLSLFGAQGFISYHQTPTGYQELYAYYDSAQPIGFTVPHGSYGPPAGASTAGFGYTGGYLTINGTNNFYGCANADQQSLQSWQLYWAPTGQLECPEGNTATDRLYILQGSA